MTPIPVYGDVRTAEALIQFRHKCVAEFATIDKLCEHLMDLLVCYCWDLAYHKQFQILNFLQSELFSDQKDLFFSKRSAYIYYIFGCDK